MNAALRAAVSLALLCAATARADSVRWIGWSPDERRCAYFLEHPYGETGYQGVTLVVRDLETGRIATRKIRDARKALAQKRPETPAILARAEEPERKRLCREGYRPGEKPVMAVSPRDPKPASPFDRENSADATVRLGGVRYRFTIRTAGESVELRAAVSGRRGPAFIAAQEPLRLQPYMTGTPDARTYRVPASYPVEFRVSPKRRRVASIWQGRAILPDGFSWPAYVFVFPKNILKR